jgi:DNA-binding MarR family transcriptional regulator
MTEGQQQPSAAVVAAWTGLIRAQRVALQSVEQRLKQAGLPPLGWYDVLWELERAGECGLRPFALEKALLLAQPNLSRLLDRLEQAGLVERRRCDSDGRGQFAAITAAGQELRRRAWQVYRAAIAEAVGTHLSEAEAGTLARLLEPLGHGAAEPD